MRAQIHINTASRPNTCKNGLSLILEYHQDIKDSLEGKNYLEQLSLLCPAGEPATHQSLSICLHQISTLPGLQKLAINTIHVVTFLLDEP